MYLCILFFAHLLSAFLLAFPSIRSDPFKSCHLCNIQLMFILLIRRFLLYTNLVQRNWLQITTKGIFPSLFLLKRYTCKIIISTIWWLESSYLIVYNEGRGKWVNRIAFLDATQFLPLLSTFQSISSSLLSLDLFLSTSSPPSLFRLLLPPLTVMCM